MKYKERNKIERFFKRLKDYRRIATRYDKFDSLFFLYNFFDSLDCKHTLMPA